MFRFQSRMAVARAVVAALLWLVPATALTEAGHLVCAAQQHGCGGVQVSRCCCPDAGHATNAAVPDATRLTVSAAPALAATDFYHAVPVFTLQVPSQSWLRGAMHRAGPPLSLSLLNSSFLI